MTELRWRLADDDGGQPALFAEEELVRRHLGRGEYAGLEFLHVNARRIITTVPPASRVPFRHTINAYRGCSHACTYCLSGDTPILMADGRSRPIAELCVGDEIVGTQRVGRYRWFVPTPVVAHWPTIKRAFRVVLDDGTELLASGDHRFLTERGWKYVTGAQQGAHRRPHLTSSNSLLGIGRFPKPPYQGAAYRRGYLCGMVRGDANLGTETRQPLRAIRTQSSRGVAAIEAIIDWPHAPSEEWAGGFLAGIHDAEGNLGQVIRISNSDPVILDWTLWAFARLGFTAVLEPPRANGVSNVRLRGGLSEMNRFILTVDPAATRKRSILGRTMKSSGARRVVAVEKTGVEMPMFDITTGTGDFIADGVVSHNCFARPTHEYLGLGLGSDFDTKLVVKVNAVERLRAELASPRWSGEHIAMGTNTDPYQRCEGKYRLTRGIVEVLGQAANPFSILTKSTLILGDLARLQAAAERADVRTSFSIATLDEDVWRATEPGTPHPLRRVEAVARLNEAGIACGVLVAPVLPGLSDSDEQLRQVVQACVAAGAVSVSAIALHLRPGVRQHFMGWLAAHRPDLVGEYERRFRRAYLPNVEQTALTQRVRAMVADARGRWSSPRQTRVVEPPPAPPPSAPNAGPPAAQLDLGL